MLIEQPKLPTAVIYTRVSSKEQSVEGYSIASQEKLLREYAQKKGFKVIAEYSDVETAKQVGRTKFGEMVEFLRKQALRPAKERCRTILVEKTDRLHRNLKDWVIIDELDVVIHLVKEGQILSQDSRSSEKLFHGIKVLMAKNYLDNLSEEARKGMAEKAEQGGYPGKAPLGYINTEQNGKRVIKTDPERAPIIKRIFEMYARGDVSLQKLVQVAEDQGLRTRRTLKPILKSTLHMILKTPLYYGEFPWNGKIMRGTHEPIISKAIFDQVQLALEENGSYRSKQQKHNWAFQGLVSCGHCGSAYTAEIKKKRYVYYHCTGSKGKCPEKYVKEELLAEKFGEAVAAIRMDAEVLSWVTTALKESHRDKAEYQLKEITRLQSQYGKLQQRIDRMYIDKLDGIIDADSFERMQNEWRQEQAKIQERLEMHRRADESYFEQGAALLELSQRAVILYEKQTMAEKRRLLDFVVSNSIWKDETLVPNYRKPFDMIVNSVKMKKNPQGTQSAGGLEWQGVLDDLRTFLMVPSPERSVLFEMTEAIAT